ncbi:MAG: hypothetical protein ACOYXT_18525 [Bacteroidota bacterium]
MALSILKNGELTDQGWSFPIDIGKNRYYRYVIGTEESKHPSGLKEISEKTFVSPLIGPLSPTAFGRDVIHVPLDRFSKEASLIQLYSYRTKDQKALAVSDIKKVKPHSLRDEDLVLPDISFSYSLNQPMNYQYSSYAYAENVPFSYRERKMSNAMFLDSIMRMVGGALPGLGNILSGLTGGGGGGIPAQLTALLNSPEVTRILQQLLTQTLQGTNTAPVAAAARQQALVESFGRYSEAKIAPALLAAMPALMPLLQQVLTPETIGRVLDAPQRMVGAVTDSLVNLGRVGIESHEQDLRHLRELHSVTGPPVDALLATLSLSLSAQEKLDKFRRLDSVHLKFADVTPLAIEGRQRVVYSANQALSFPLIFESPGAVTNVKLQLAIKRPTDSKTVYLKTYKIKRVENGALKQKPTVSLETVKNKLKPNEEYMVTAQLTWTNKKNETVGTVMSQLVYLMENYIYAGTDSSGEPIPLNDVDKFREFWHKVWAVSFKPEKKRYKIDCKYYYILEKDRSNIGRMETLTKEEDDSFPVHMKMKSGSILNVKALNMLLPKISQYQPLTEEELAALDSDEFTQRFHAVARMGLDFNGYDKENAVLWVYPEVKMHKFILKTPVSINPNGAVTGLVDKAVFFPVPSSVHFIGAKSGNQ